MEWYNNDVSESLQKDVFVRIPKYDETIITMITAVHSSNFISMCLL